MTEHQRYPTSIDPGPLWQHDSGHTCNVSQIAAVLLAAGAGSRFEGATHKLLASLPATNRRPAETVVQRSLAALVTADVGPVVVVSGAVDLSQQVAPDRILDMPDHVQSGQAQSDQAPPDDAQHVTLIHNPRWAEGQATSVHVGLAAARAIGAEAAVIGLGDQPGIDETTWRKIADRATRATITVATYAGRRGNPVALGSDIWELLPEEGDEGARTVMRLRPDLVVEVPCTGSSDDIDTTEDLRRWQNNSSTNSP